jgi:hypothetical protein
MIGAVLSDVAAFEGKKPVTVEVPASSTVSDLSEYGLGKVRVDIASFKMTLTKQ